MCTVHTSMDIVYFMMSIYYKKTVLAESSSMYKIFLNILSRYKTCLSRSRGGGEGLQDSRTQALGWPNCCKYELSAQSLPDS